MPSQRCCNNKSITEEDIGSSIEKMYYLNFKTLVMLIAYLLLSGTEQNAQALVMLKEDLPKKHLCDEGIYFQTIFFAASYLKKT